MFNNSHSLGLDDIARRAYGHGVGYHAVLIWSDGSAVACGTRSRTSPIHRLLLDLPTPFCSGVTAPPWHAATMRRVSATSLRCMQASPTRRLPLDHGTAFCSGATVPP
eukprot:8792366-Pyramimonas_sp.AAC.1